MDTFAALALASIPPSESVMQEKPRKPGDFIITHGMRHFILGYGVTFVVVLIGLLYMYNHSPEGMTLHRLTIFFTVFVMLQFWNLFNAKTFGSEDSAFNNLEHSYGLLLVALLIFIGQLLIVQAHHYRFHLMCALDRRNRATDQEDEEVKKLTRNR